MILNINEDDCLEFDKFYNPICLKDCEGNIYSFMQRDWSIEIVSNGKIIGALQDGEFITKEELFKE